LAATDASIPAEVDVDTVERRRGKNSPYSCDDDDDTGYV
jgi:hypothetical protein